jgi:hypothetical protein
MDIMYIPIQNYSDVECMESEVCRLLRCKYGKCAAMHTEAFMLFRAKLLRGVRSDKVYLPEGLVLQAVQSGVEFSWAYY